MGQYNNIIFASKYLILAIKDVAIFLYDLFVITKLIDDK
jgi:hypothetical protein